MKPPMQITMRYFAGLRDRVGCSEETVQTEADTPRALYETLQQRHGVTYPARALRVAVNDRFTGFDEPLRDGDTVAFIPPVAGG